MKLLDALAIVADCPLGVSPKDVKFQRLEEVEEFVAKPEPSVMELAVTPAAARMNETVLPVGFVPVGMSQPANSAA